MIKEELLIEGIDMKLFNYRNLGVIIAAAGSDDVYLDSEDAIIAARAILTHFGEDK